jgi:PKD repeat protein/Flp pilus assembly protein TadG
MMSTSPWRHATHQRRTRSRTQRRGLATGQSLVEFALVLPVLLLILLFAIDFGRAFFGYVIVNNAARLGANYAALHPTANWGSPSDPAVVEYARLIRSDTNVANCALAAVPTPVFADGPDSGTTATDVTDTASVGLTCAFRPLTPVIGAILGNSVNLSARADYPVRAGGVAGAILPPPPPPPPGLDCPVPTTLVGQNENNAESIWSGAGFTGAVTRVGNGNNWTIAFASPSSGTAACNTGVTIYRTAPGNQPPNASFTATPASGAAPLTVSVDGSASSDPDGTITGYTWNFGDGTNGSGPTASHTYTLPGTYTITLGVTDNGGATGVATRTISATGPPNQPPTASFTLAPSPVGVGQTVTVNGSGSSDPDGSIVGWTWNFGDNGTSTGQTTTHAYAVPGTYTVTLTVTDNAGATASATGSVVVQCVVPQFVGNGTKRNSAQGIWAAAKFTSTVSFSPDPNGNWTITGQSLAANSLQACNATITVSP